ncbi:MAG: pyridoxal-phosphate dependent enzyme [Alphaproteobacteria bacterium]
MTGAPRAFANVLEMIGNTPLVELTHLDTGPCRLFLKLESQNPGGSIKDRIGHSMIEAAERDGLLQPGGVIIEATAGNTGLGLALVAVQKGYRLLLVIPDKMSQEKIFHLRALGVEVILTRSDVGKGHPDYYQDVAARLARETPGSFFVNQFANPSNPRAHEETTGPEIWEQMEGSIDAIVCGVGSGGTMAGLSHYFARVAPAVEMILADPEGSIIAEYVRSGQVAREVGSWLVEGIGEDFVPAVADLSHVKRAYTIPDREAFLVCREVLRREGILAGTSSGTLIAAALRYCREQEAPRRVVSFVCDSGNKYLSKVYNDYWMLDQGFLERPQHHDLTDLILRQHRQHATVTVAPDDTLTAALSRMKLYDVSQLPVMTDDHIVGIVDEEDILIRVFDHEERFRDPVASAMTRKLEIVAPTAPLSAVLDVLRKGHVVIVSEGEQFLGLITRIDLLNYLRRRMK